MSEYFAVLSGVGGLGGHGNRRSRPGLTDPNHRVVARRLWVGMLGGLATIPIARLSHFTLFSMRSDR